MARFLRFVFALAALPFAYALALVFVDAFRLMPLSGSGFLPPGAVWLSAGFMLFLVSWVFLPAPVRLYVLGHELTHALWGLAFGAKPSNLKVGLKGGSVMLTKSNVWITLAPYFFPFWTAIVGLVALVVRCFVTPLPCPGAWLFAVVLHASLLDAGTAGCARVRLLLLVRLHLDTQRSRRDRVDRVYERGDVARDRAQPCGAHVVRLYRRRALRRVAL